MSHDTITFENRAGIAVLTLNRPARLNAINKAMIDDLNAQLDGIERDESVRAVVLTGAGRAFCAGFDLKEGAATPKAGIADWRPIIQRDFELIMRFWHLSRPTIAAVHGHCVAAGCELALACDITIAAESALFGEPELRFGSGIVALLMPWFAGPKKAKEWILSGNDKVTAAEAMAWGLVNRVVPDGQHLEAALKLARDIAVNDRVKVSMVKQAINRTFDIMGMRDALAVAMETEVQLEAMETPEGKTFRDIARKDGLKAALAWRDGRFGGG